MNVFKGENGLYDNPGPMNSYAVQRDNMNRQESRSRLIKNIIMKDGGPAKPVTHIAQQPDPIHV